MTLFDYLVAAVVYGAVSTFVLYAASVYRYNIYVPSWAVCTTLITSFVLATLLAPIALVNLLVRFKYASTAFALALVMLAISNNHQFSEADEDGVLKLAGDLREYDRDIGDILEKATEGTYK